MRDAWDPSQYERFRAEREQPFWDLASLLRARAPGLLVDLGCGTGELTAALHTKLGAAHSIGVDQSVAMLERAAAQAKAGITFVQADVREWSPDRVVDVLFANAALQWVDDHERLFPRLIGWLAPGGELAVQMPANFDHPSHTVAAAVAAEEPFIDALHGYVRIAPVLPAEQYAILLHAHGCSEQHVRLQVYGHELQSSLEVVEWVRGSLLTDYESRLPRELYGRFLARYRERLRERLGDVEPYFYAFKRILLWGRRGPG